MFQFLVDFLGIVSEFHTRKTVEPQIVFSGIHDFHQTFVCDSVMSSLPDDVNVPEVFDSGNFKVHEINFDFIQKLSIKNS